MAWILLNLYLLIIKMNLKILSVYYDTLSLLDAVCRQKIQNIAYVCEKQDYDQKEN